MKRKKLAAIICAVFIFSSAFTASFEAHAAARSITDGLAVGDEVSFGKNAQFNDEPILWRVMSVSGGTATLCSVYLLENRPFGEDFAKYNWSDSPMCQYLNGEFLQNSFTAEEQALILPYGTSETASSIGIGTIDISQKVVLPSYDEVKRNGLWGDVTDFNKASHVDKSLADDYREGGASPGGLMLAWYLRTPGYHAEQTFLMSSNGASPYYMNNYVRSGKQVDAGWIPSGITGDVYDLDPGVRPVIKVSAENLSRNKCELRLKGWTKWDDGHTVNYELYNPTIGKDATTIALVLYDSGLIEVHYIEAIGVEPFGKKDGSFHTQWPGSSIIKKEGKSAIVAFDSETEAKEFLASVPWREWNTELGEKPEWRDYELKQVEGAKWLKDKLNLELSSNTQND